MAKKRLTWPRGEINEATLIRQLNKLPPDLQRLARKFLNKQPFDFFEELAIAYHQISPGRPSEGFFSKDLINNIRNAADPKWARGYSKRIFHRIEELERALRELYIEFRSIKPARFRRKQLQEQIRKETPHESVRRRRLTRLFSESNQQLAEQFIDRLDRITTNLPIHDSNFIAYLALGELRMIATGQHNYSQIPFRNFLESSLLKWQRELQHRCLERPVKECGYCRKRRDSLCFPPPQSYRMIKIKTLIRYLQEYRMAMKESLEREQSNEREPAN